ncbi:MAG: hypothetical protein WA813_21090, partial [Beijerinckiaceae bacterium]
MAQDLSELPEYRHTMERLEAVKRVTKSGVEYWMARDISPLLGYPTWREFEKVVDRARDAFRGNGVDPSHHIV